MSLPGSTVAGAAVVRPSGVAASTRSTRQCLVAGVAQLTYTRQRPSGVSTSAGRSSDSAPNRSRSSRATSSNRTPSVEAATTLR